MPAIETFTLYEEESIEDIDNHRYIMSERERLQYAKRLEYPNNPLGPCSHKVQETHVLLLDSQSNEQQNIYTNVNINEIVSLNIVVVT